MKHKVIEERALAMDKIIAQRVQENPTLVEAAKENIERWLRTCSPGVRRPLLEWREILSRGLDKTIAVMLATDEKATQLRQSSPFAGEKFISREERYRVLREIGPQR